MPKNKKKFIDKKNATTYSLVQRSLHPIGEDSPDYVPPAPLTREELLTRQEEHHKYGIFYNDGYDYLKHLREVSHAGGVLEQQYEFRLGQTASDFLLETQSVISAESRQQPPSVATSIRVPHPAASASTAVSAAALLEAAFRDSSSAELDLDVLNAMNEDFNFDDPQNVLDDNFVVQAKGLLDENIDEEFPGLEDDDELAPDYVDPTKSLHKGRMVEAWIEHQAPEDEHAEATENNARDRNSTAAMIKQWVKSRQDVEGEMGMEDDNREEKRSRFSNYSMTSSVMRRSDGLRLLDDRFEKMMEQYDEEEIGGMDLDDHEQEGENGSVVLNSILAEKDTSQADFDAMMLENPTEPDPVAMKFQYEDDENQREKRVKVIIEQDDDKYDCQSVAGTRTSRNVQPKILDPPRKPQRILIDPKTGIPREMTSRRGRKASQSSSSGSDDSGSDTQSDVLSLISSLSVARPKNETPEERKLRKQTLKALRRERRVEKKSCRVAFTEEKVRQEKEVANVQRRLKTIAMV